jgi:hypothetical protein
MFTSLSVCRASAGVLAIFQGRMQFAVLDLADQGLPAPDWLLAIPLEIQVDAFDRIWFRRRRRGRGLPLHGFRLAVVVQALPILVAESLVPYIA